MLKRPQWVKEKIEGREKQIPIQMTVKKKYSMGTPYADMPTMGMTTGNGVDGIVQPGKMVDIQVHEGEGIIPNNAMQGLTGEEFQGLIETLSTGNIDKNKLREAINMPTVAEYQTGGIIDRTNYRSRGIPDERTTDAEIKPVESIPPTKEEYLRMRYPNFGTDKNTTQTISALEPVTQENTTRDLQVKMPTSQPQTMAAIEPVAAEKPARDLQVQVPTQAPQTIAPMEEVAAPQEPTSTFEFKPPPPIEETAAQEQTVTTPVTSPANEMIRVGLQNILKEAQGVSDVDRKIADFYLQNIDASEAANLRILESQISADPEMSEQGKQAAIRGLQREAAARRSEQVGQMGIAAAERSSQAARDLITYGGQVRTYDEITLPQARQNMEIKDWTFENFTKPMNELELQQFESDVGAENWDKIQDMINKGLGPDRVNEALADMGIRPLTTDEYGAMYQAGSLGERNWGRDLAAAEMQLTLGQYDAAATTYSNLYDGIDFDFSKLATQETAENFNQGLSQMASYLDADLSFDEAIEMMRTDQTLELMGIDETQAAQFYEANRVNALDAEWEEVEESKAYQALLNSDDPADRQEAADIKLMHDLEVMGLLDREILHEYKIYQNNTPYREQPSIYAKSAEEAQAEVDKLGVGFTVEDTGNISAIIKEEPITTVTGGDLKEAWNEFEKSIPSGVDVTENLYKRWEIWQKDNPGGKYNDFLETEPAANKLQTIDVATNSELTDKQYSDILFDTYKEDPESLKSSEYFFKMPDQETINKAIRTTESGKGTAGNIAKAVGFAFGGLLGVGAVDKIGGKRTTEVDKAMEETLNNSHGLFFESPDGKISGQIVNHEVYPTSVQLMIKQADGTTVPYVFYGGE